MVSKEYIDMIIVRRSPFSGQVHEMDLPITQAELDEFNSPQGRLIQDIWPDLTPGQREFIKTGITDEEWDAAFGPGGEQDELSKADSHEETRT